jgi:predicted DNA-binding protein (MmcQ/YjbR family)
MPNNNVMTKSDLETFCMTLPGTKQSIKWGADLCFVVSEKMYCVTSVDGPLAASFKVLPEEMQPLTEREGIIPAPYMAKNNWVYVETAKGLTPKEWKYFVKQSYDLVVEKLPKKVQVKLTARKK